MLRIQTTFNFFAGLFSIGAIATIVGACSSSSSGASNSTSCDNYANATLNQEIKCGASAISADERANYVSRFRTVCTNGLSAPGTGITAGFLDGCTAAIGNNASCTSAIPQCVAPAGSLANGAACGSDDQCQSTHCAITGSSSGDGGATVVASCGVCAPTIADGAPCAPTDTCVEGDQCVNGVCGKQTTSTGGTGPLGSACQGDSDCATPNHCDFTQGVCAAPGAAGSPCTLAADCAAGLICTSGQQCEAPVASGGACVGGDCASGLGCNTTTHKCGSITFAAAGAPCDKDGVLCDRGTCIVSSAGGVCPNILADGAPCDSGSTTTACDDFAQCISGTCQVSNPASCK
jgi:hypothetical protein